MQLRVLYLYKDYYPVLGGIENHMRVLAEGLHGRGVATQVLVTNTANRTLQETIGGVPVTKTARQVNISSAPLSLQFLAAVRRLERGIDIAHAHMPYPPGELAHLLLGRARRFVVSYHSDIVRQRLLGALYRPFLWQVLAQARRIAVSNPLYVQDSVFLRRYADKCRIIPYGQDWSRFALTAQVQAAAAAWRVRYDQRPLLLFVGRLRHYKGVDVLIEAMQQLPDATALIVGIGPFAAAWQGAAQAAGVGERVHFLGDQPDAALPGLYHAADIFVLPSTNRAETFGIVQSEAMACGCPLVCTELGTGTSYVNQHEVTGLVVPPNDAPALAAALRRLLDDPPLRQRMGEAGRRRSQAEFSIDAMLNRTLEMYTEALA